MRFCCVRPWIPGSWARFGWRNVRGKSWAYGPAFFAEYREKCGGAFLRGISVDNFRKVNQKFSVAPQRLREASPPEVMGQKAAAQAGKKRTPASLPEFFSLPTDTRQGGALTRPGNSLAQP
jgi:hypothetical protein